MTAKKTIVKTTDFFKRWLDIFLAFSGKQLADLKPDNLVNLYPFENTYSPRIQVAERIIYCTAKSINMLKNEPKEPYQDIIIYYYLDKLYSYEVQKRINYASSQYFVFKRNALTEFTKYFNMFAKQEGLASIIKLAN